MIGASLCRNFNGQQRKLIKLRTRQVCLGVALKLAMTQKFSKEKQTHLKTLTKTSFYVWWRFYEMKMIEKKAETAVDSSHFMEIECFDHNHRCSNVGGKFAVVSPSNMCSLDVIWGVVMIECLDCNESCAAWRRNGYINSESTWLHTCSTKIAYRS